MGIGLYGGVFNEKRSYDQREAAKVVKGAQVHKKRDIKSEIADQFLGLNPVLLLREKL